jgi:hypothetical protein
MRGACVKRVLKDEAGIRGVSDLRCWLHLCFEDASDRRRISRASTVIYHEDVGQARPARREVT